MTDHRALLVERATKPLAGQQGEHAAALEEVRGWIDASGVSDAAVGEAIRCFERADRRGIVRHWKIILYGTVAVLVVIGVMQNFRMRSVLGMISGMTSLRGVSSSSMPERPTRYSEDQRLLLYGRDGTASEAERWKPLWDSDPKNPAYFAEYVKAAYRDTENVSDEVLREAAKIDPDNGWYGAMKAGSLLMGALERESYRKEDRKALKAVQYTVSNEDDFTKAIALLHEVAGKPKYESYLKDMMQKRLRVMGKSHDWISYITKLTYAASESLPGFAGVSKYSQALAVEAERCAQRGDPEGFQRVIATWEVICKRQMDSGASLVELLLARMCYTEPATNFRDAAQKLGLENEVKRFDDLARWVLQETEERRGRNDSSDQDALLERRASLMAALALPMVRNQVRKPPIITENDLRPSRLLEHAFFLRILGGFGCLILLAAAGAVAIRLGCTARRMRVLSSRWCEVLGWRDWLVILLVGPLLPILCYGLQVYVSPFSSRDWTLRAIGVYQLPLQYAALVIWMMTLTSVLATRVYEKRVRFLPGRVKFSRLPWIMVGSAGCAVVLMGALTPLVYRVGMQGSAILAVFMIACAFAVTPMLWLVFRLIKPVFGLRDRTPRTATLIQMVVPGLCAGILALSAVSPLLRWEEKFWLSQDRLMEITPDAPAMSRFEWEVTQIFREELRELMANP